jgi:hypothetical protein
LQHNTDPYKKEQFMNTLAQPPFAKLPEIEIDSYLSSMGGLNQFMVNVSASRGVMFTGNLGQWLVVNGLTERYLYTGIESEYGKATFSQGFDEDVLDTEGEVKIRNDVEIIKVIRRYPDAGLRGCKIKSNPTTVVIFENYDSKEIGVLSLTEFHSTHQHFGFRYVEDKEVFDKLTPGAMIPAGTVVRHSPGVCKNGNYMFGLETNVMYCSDPAVIEDGIKVSEAYLDRISPTGYGTLTIEFGKGHFPINLYGSPEDYKIFPNIGEKINTSGLLMCLRKHDNITNVVNMNINSVCMPDYIYDRKKYAVPAGARIVDIKVSRNTKLSIPPMPVGMEEQLMMYWEADNTFYRKILDVYWSLRGGPRGRGIHMRTSPEFHNLVVEAIHRCGVDYHPSGQTNSSDRQTAMDVRSEYRGVPLDAWRVEITYEHKSVPTIGYKLTNLMGGKGVICAVIKTEDMPIDDNGNRVEVMMDDTSITRRINPGVFYEQYINAAARDTLKRLKQMIGYDLPNDATNGQIREFFTDRSGHDAFVEGYKYLLGFYKIVTPIQHDKLLAAYGDDIDKIIYHLVSVCRHTDGIHMYFPINNPVHRPTMIRELVANYPAIKTPVTFRGERGDMVRTKMPMLIGSMYFMVLEKTAEDWSSVASAKLQVYGTPARLTKFDKDSAPGRQNVVKTIGESESRALAACIGGEETADIMDATNNPVAHKAIYRKILTADKPTDIDEVLDRSEIPKGGHRPRNFVTHILECSGKVFARDEDIEHYDKASGLTFHRDA